MAVEITRKDMSAGDLRVASVRTKDAKAARRMLALALVREGPGLETDGVVRGRRIDLRRSIAARFGVVMHERRVGKPLEVWFQE